MPRPWHRLVILCLFVPAALMRSQQVPTFSASVKVVNVLATVREKKGPIVKNLTKDDFLLEEDGRPQMVRYFAQETNLPLTLGLLVDTSLSQRRVLEQERTASYSFLDHMLREKDLAFVIHFDREVELLQDLTPSRQKLEAALSLLQTPEPMRRSVSTGGPWPGPGPTGGPVPSGGHRAAGTLLYDSVYLASDELMQKQEGRKAYIILTDGVDIGSKLTLERAIESSQRANTIVYSILFSDESAYGNPGGFGGHMGGMGRHGGYGYPRFPQPQHADGKKVLERMSKETGGRMFEVSKKLPIDQIYAQIEEELRNQYNLGYTPERAAGTASGYHKIHVATKQKDLIVQARDGYYAEQ
ncbi:MAG TPA: VWA domain-containing protein [Terriglobales bacterium]|nr:VWA domain-containing protein [Terriglobales bacterium]